MPLRNPQERGIRREFNRRFGAGEFPGPGGVNKQGSPSGIAPNEQRNLENGRYREDSIINRGGQSKYSATPFAGTVRGIVGFGPADGAPNPRNGSDGLAPDTVDDDGNAVRPPSYGSLYPRLFMLHDTQNYVLDPEVSPSWQKFPTPLPGTGVGDPTGGAYQGALFIGGTDSGDLPGSDVCLRTILPVVLPPGETFLGSALKPIVRIRFAQPAASPVVISFVTSRGVLYFGLYQGGHTTTRVYSWDGTTLKVDNLVDVGHFWPVMFRFGDSIGWASGGSSAGSSDLVNFAQLRNIDGVWTTLPFDAGVVWFRCKSAVEHPAGLLLGGWNGDDATGRLCVWDGVSVKLLRNLGTSAYIVKMALAPDGNLYYLHGFVEGPADMRIGKFLDGVYSDVHKNLSAQFPADGGSSIIPEDMVVFRERMYVLARNVSGAGNGFLYSGALNDMAGSWTREATWTPYTAAQGGNNKPSFNRLVVF